MKAGLLCNCTVSFLLFYFIVFHCWNAWGPEIEARTSLLAAAPMFHLQGKCGNMPAGKPALLFCPQRLGWWSFRNERGVWVSLKVFTAFLIRDSSQRFWGLSTGCLLLWGMESAPWGSSPACGFLGEDQERLVWSWVERWVMKAFVFLLRGRDLTVQKIDW